MVNKFPLATTVAALSIVGSPRLAPQSAPHRPVISLAKGRCGTIRAFGDDIGLTVGLNQRARSPQPFAGPPGIRIVQTRRSPMNFLCKFLIWSFLCCLLATRGQARETKLGDGI